MLHNKLSAYIISNSNTSSTYADMSGDEAVKPRGAGKP